MAKKPSKTLKVLAENLERLMQASLEFSNDSRVAARAKVDQKTVWRIVHLQNEPSIDKLERIAAVFGLEAWQLLVPQLDPMNKPTITREEAAA